MNRTVLGMLVFILCSALFFILIITILSGRNKNLPPDKPSLKSVTVYTEHEIQRKGAENIHINIIVIKNHEYIIFDSKNGIEAIHSASCACYRR